MKKGIQKQIGIEWRQVYGLLECIKDIPYIVSEDPQTSHQTSTSQFYTFFGYNLLLMMVDANIDSDTYCARMDQNTLVRSNLS